MGRLTLGQDLSMWGLSAAIALLILLAGGTSPSRLLLPGALIVVVGCCGLTLGARPRTRTTAGATLLLITALTMWTLASGKWAWASSWATRDETSRMLVLAAAFAAGMCWFEHGRARQALVTMLAATSGLACTLIAVRARVLEQPLSMFAGYRLEWPVDYANGVAAIAVTGTVLGIAAASLQLDHARRRRIHRARYNQSDGQQTALPTRGGMLVGLLCGLAVASGGILQLTQSRAAIASLLIGMTLLIVLSPTRRQIGALTMVVAAAQIAVSGFLATPFRTIGDATRAGWEGNRSDVRELTQAAVASVHDASLAILISAIATTFLIGGIATWKLRTSHEAFDRDVAIAAAVTPQRLRNRAMLALGMLALLALTSLATPGHGPVGWTISMFQGCSAQKRASEAGGALSRRSHFADPDVGRCDFWRVALRDLRDAPIEGTGAGNFGDRYARYGATGQRPDYAHSIGMSLAGELGLIGLALGGALLAGTLAGAWQLISPAPRQAAAEIALLAAGSSWLMHATVDWMWQIPATAVPAMLMAGSLARGTAVRAAEAPRTIALLAPAALVSLAILLMLSPAVADRSVMNATSKLRAAHAAQSMARKRSLARQARAHAVRAARVSPSWSVPLLAIAQADDLLRRPRLAARTRRQAVRLEPRSREIQTVLHQSQTHRSSPRSKRSH